MDKHLEMGRGSTGRLLWKYSLPAIAGMMLASLYNVVDRIFVGQATGSVGLAAVSVAFPVTMVGFAAAILANSGGSSLVARLLGSGDKAGAERALGQATLVGTVLSAVTALVILPFLDPILRLFGASDATLEPARIFSLLMLAAFPFQGAAMGLNAGVRSQGKAKTAMFLMLAGVVLNIALCGWFVLGLGWGVAGSALATLLSQVFGMVLAWGFYASGAGSLRFRFRNLAWSPAEGRDILQVGFGSWLMNVIPVVLFIILNNAMARVAGDVGLAVIGIVNTIAMMTVLPCFGIMQGAAPLLGYNHGAGDHHRVRRVFLQSLGAITGLLFLFWIPIELFPRAILQAFAGQDQSLLDLGLRAVPVYLLILPLIGLPIALTQYYQSVGKGMHATLMGMSRQVLFLVPALILMPLWWGLDGLLWAGPVSDALGVGMAALFLAVTLPRMVPKGQAASVPKEAVPSESA